MAEETPQDDKTEEPTARRLEKAREDGQVLRSQDLTIAVVTTGFLVSIYLLGFYLGPALLELYGASCDTFLDMHTLEELALNSTGYHPSFDPLIEECTLS